MVQRIASPGFLCRRHAITRVKEHPLQKIDTLYALPPFSVKSDDPSRHFLWTWSRQDVERNFSVLNTHRGKSSILYLHISVYFSKFFSVIMSVIAYVSNFLKKFIVFIYFVRCVYFS